MSAGTVAGFGRRIKGPSAFGDGDLLRFVNLARTLAVTDWKLRFFGSVLGYFWQLMRPLLLFGVLYFVFTELVRLGGGVKNYPVILLMGIIIYTFYAEATGTAVGSTLMRCGTSTSPPVAVGPTTTNESTLSQRSITSLPEPRCATIAEGW